MSSNVYSPNSARDFIPLPLADAEPFPIFGWPSPVVYVLYPLIPWIGVMAAGYAFGALYKIDAQQRRRLLAILGSMATVFFVLLRALNYYGDPSHWSRQGTTTFTVLSFLNTTKYPPSLLFLLAHGAPDCSFCALRRRQALARDVWQSDWGFCPTAWRGFQPGGCLRLLDYWRAVALPLVQMVCLREGSTTRLVAVISLTRPPHRIVREKR